MDDFAQELLQMRDRGLRSRALLAKSGVLGQSDPLTFNRIWISASENYAAFCSRYSQGSQYHPDSIGAYE